MQLQIAQDSDSAELSEFHKSFTSRGLVEFKLDRGADYFSHYRAQGSDFRTYVLRDNVGIQATASFVIRECLFNGQVVRAAYANDLRVSNSRKAILEWSQHFLPVMKEVEHDFKTDHLFSMLNLSEPSALNAFIRPRTMKRPLPRYYLYRKFNLYTLHGRFPFSPPPLSAVRVREGSKANFDALLDYLIQRAQYRPFSSTWDAASLQKKFTEMKNFERSNFLIAFDSQDKIVGCVAPWRPEGMQKLLPLSYSLRAHNFRQFLKFARFLGWTRPLTKPVASTGAEAPLNYQILTHLFAINEDVFDTLLFYAFQRAKKNEFLVYTQCDQDFKLRPAKSWISAHIPYALYSVVSPEKPMPDFLHPSEILNPEFDPILL